MTAEQDHRPDPEDLLDIIRREEQSSQRGKLKIFFGMCAGVGKTYDMLKAAQVQKSKGLDIVIGFVETHGRKETEALLEGLPLISRKHVEYKGKTLDEMDLDSVLARKPALVLVDELAHTNVPGSRHTKRFQDVLELLDNGIDVYTTLNVQHLESRADTVAQITGSIVRETVPDSILEMASEVELVDIPPEELLKRLEEGKVYTQERSRQAVLNFFRKGNLTALREMALRLTAERVDHQLRDLMKSQRIAETWKSGQRLLVGISSSPHSVSLIRWARRTAYTMDATWVAVYVESSRQLTQAKHAQLAKNIDLARTLGAEIVTTADENLVQGILRVAREQNATQVLIGKTRRLFPFKKSFLDQLIEQSGDLDIYVVGGEKEETKSRTFQSASFLHSGPRQYFAAAAIVTLIAAACYPLRPVVGYQTISLILLLAVTLLPLKMGTGPVIIAAGLSALFWNFFFIPPQFTFAIAEPQDILMFVVYFVIAAVMGVLTTRVRAREKAVRVREERAVALYTLTNDLSVANSLDDVAHAAVRNIKKFFDAEAVVCLSESDGDLFTTAHPASSLKIDDKEFSVAAWVHWNERSAGRFTDTLPSAQATYYPLSGPRYSLGVIGIKNPGNERPAIEQETLLQNFMRQISSSLEREQLNELARRTMVIAESERLYRSLFDSISHEFKTPIASILGTAEHLMHNPSLSDSSDRELLREIHDDAGRLNRLVANLLDITRLESGLLKPKLDWVDVGDLLSTTVRKLTDVLPGHKVTIRVDRNVPLAKLDFGLMEQALSNLLHNASIHTPEGTSIEISAQTDNAELVLIIADDGPGVPPGAAERLFQKFFRVPRTKSGGTGLGLSIVKGFVEAHSGKIMFQNRPGGGAQFTIRLPLDRPTSSHQNNDNTSSGNSHSRC